MVELWETSMMWRILINLFGAVSIIIGIWIIVRLFKQISLRMRKGKGLSNQFVQLMSLPPIIKGNRQIGCVLKESQQVQISVLDEFENTVFSIYSGKLEEGEQIFKVDFNKLNNGNYYLSVTTDKQDILRKITVKN